LLPDGWIGRRAAKTLRIPYIVFLHGEERCYTDASRQLNWMAHRVCRDAAAVVVNGENTSRIAREYWRLPADKVYVLHPGVDGEQFAPADPSPTIRTRLGWDDRPVILTVSRLQARKGQDQLIRALPAIRKVIPNVLYAIVGDGERRPHLERLVDEMNLSSHIRFHGQLTDGRLVECYQQCDVFVLPNRRLGNDVEGFGMVLLEAQACGKPVIAGNTGGAYETMDVGRSGYVVDIDDIGALATSVASVLSQPDLCRSMGEAARARVVAYFDWDALACAADAIFNRRVGIKESATPAPMTTS
jgi:phosphatidylinositol alpha-1,6-mannosyltransferase